MYAVDHISFYVLLRNYRKRKRFFNTVKNVFFLRVNALPALIRRVRIELSRNALAVEEARTIP